MNVRSAFARLPKVDAVLDAAPLSTLAWRREVVRAAVRESIAALRRRIEAGETVDVPDVQQLATQVRALLESWVRPRPRRVLNATGVVLHTNLGRAPLSTAAIEAMADAAGYCDLEVGLADGKRGSRFVWLRPLVAAVTGAEDAHVVNNNAAGLLLACTVLGDSGGVVLSRGQMVEIGDSFRVATMAAAGGCRVIAVGSTNRTHRADYEQALRGSDAASAILWVHQSNFEQRGFVSEVGLPELAEIARAFGVPLIADLGSGSLGLGLPEREPTIAAYLEQGADLVLASGDKLLGGPQGGVIAGRAELVQRCRKHPMARALRPDKTTLAAMHATFVAHASGGVPELPLHRMLGHGVAELRARAHAIAELLAWGDDAVVDVAATIGGGSLPGDTMPSVALVVPTRGASADRLARRLRLGDPPVVGRIEHDRLLLDLRTIDPADDAALVSALRALAQ
jgi:L-seryl-tRNA(Ser) seleniumtransferase